MLFHKVRNRSEARILKMSAVSEEKSDCAGVVLESLNSARKSVTER